MSPASLLLLVSLCFSAAQARPDSPSSTPVGIRCSASNNRIDPATTKLLSDCAETMYCPRSVNDTTRSNDKNQSQICADRLCRRDEFPFGYAVDEPLPPLCPPGAFCPDDGSGCRVLVDIGETCELARDEQCAGMSWTPICLHSTCMYANATLGLACVTETTTYINTWPNGEQTSNAITRDNCASPGLYCDPTTLVCLNARALNDVCAVDYECFSGNCASGVCKNPPETPLRIAPWQSALVSTTLVGAIIGLGLWLNIIHNRRTLANSRVLHDYCYQQLHLRRAMFAIRAGKGVE
ncbi:hypothetical protein MKEN_00479900 [Mycena kentingensis (nom. inval.)]|nr:hypothetical protein MKEN_00479900 [Mycena kentingensis (nom. inval.)]